MKGVCVMKSSDIRNAYKAVRADNDLKEKILLRAIAEEGSPESVDSSLSGYGEVSRIRIKKGGGIRRIVSTLCTLAAAFALVFSFRLLFREDNIQEADESLPPDTAEVAVKVVDGNGNFLKNLRVDYFPAVYRTAAPENKISFFDEENTDKAGMIPITCGEAETLRLRYGDYIFIVSDALPNDTISVRNYDRGGLYTFLGFSATGGTQRSVTVDENTAEIVLHYKTGSGDGTYQYSRGEIILQDKNGAPLSDYAVILRPVSGEMAEGYSDIYGGYVLPRTDEDGSSVWNNPIEGEYTVIAYRERLHTADIPITEPFVVSGDDTFSYVKKETLLPTYKIYRQAQETN